MSVRLVDRPLRPAAGFKMETAAESTSHGMSKHDTSRESGFTTRSSLPERVRK